jgi:hypothetical protein
MNFNELAIKLNNIIYFSKKFCLAIVKEDDEEILDLNRGQLFEGKQADGTDIEGGYSRYTEAINEGETFEFNGKTKRKNFNETYFLKDTGEFYDSFKLETKEESFVISANTQKPDNNLLIYGKNLVGLTKENLQNLTIDLTQQLYKELNTNYFL